MMREAAQRGVKVVVNSNSTLWTPELAERTIASGVARIKLSIDSADAEEFRCIRGVALDGVCKKIRLLTEAKQRSGRRRPVLQLNVVVQAGNLLHLDRFFPLADELGVDRLRFKSVLGFRVDELHVHKVESAAESTVRDALARAREAAEGTSVENNFAKFAKRLETKGAERGVIEQSEGEPEGCVPQCIYPWFATFISNRGVVRPCCKFYRDGMFDAGNILEQPMRSIWHGEGYRRARERFVARQPIHAVCLDCDQHDRSRALLERARRRYPRLAR
jgi:MoaA/NifB/PqqE/SkfB family radical SAM enzyme